MNRDHPPFFRLRSQKEDEGPDDHQKYPKRRVERINAAQVEGFGKAFGLRLYNDPAQTDCWQANSKWMLAPECPDFSAQSAVVQGKVRCHPIAGLTQAQLEAFRIAHHLQGVPDVAALAATGEPWVLIEAHCRTEFTWGVLSTVVDSLTGAGTLTPAQQQRFDAIGATRGVSQ